MISTHTYFRNFERNFCPSSSFKQAIQTLFCPQLQYYPCHMSPVQKIWDVFISFELPVQQTIWLLCITFDFNLILSTVFFFPSLFISSSSSSSLYLPPLVSFCSLQAFLCVSYPNTWPLRWSGNTYITGLWQESRFLRLHRLRSVIITHTAVGSNMHTYT